MIGVARRWLASASQAESILPIPAILIEALWVLPWMAWISTWERLSWGGPPLGPGSTLAVIGIAYLSAKHAAGASNYTRAALGTLLGSLVLLALLLRLEQGAGFPIWDPAWGAYAEGQLGKLIAGLFFGTYLLWRGLSLGREPISFDRVYRSFGIGIAALALLMVVWSAGASRGAFAGIEVLTGAYIAAFFLAGLTALALSNFRDIQEEARRLGPGSEGLSRRWIVLAAIMAIVMVLLALAVASIVSLDFVSYLQGPLSTMAHWLFIAFLYVVVWPLGHIIIGIAFVVRWIISWLRSDAERPEFERFNSDDLRKAAEEKEGLTVPPELITAGKWGLLALAVGIAAFLLLRFYLRRRPQRDQAGTEEISESLFTWDQFWADLLAFFAGLFGFFNRSKGRGLEEAASDRGEEIDEDDGRTLDIREVYRRLLREGRRTGRPKREYETPYEYAARLNATLPLYSGDLDAITKEYVSARYGRESIQEDRLAFLNNIWHRIREAFRAQP